MATGTVQVTGNPSASFAALARDLRRAGASGLRRELYAGLQRAARPAIRTVRDSAEVSLPMSGGLAARVAGSSITPRALTGRNPGIRIVARERRGRNVDLYRLDAGTVRHPVFGHRRTWVSQAVTPGWFTRPMERSAPLFRRGLLDAIDTIERQISG